MDMFYYKYMLNKEKAKLAVALGSDHYLFLQLKLDALVKFDKERIKLFFYMI